MQLTPLQKTKSGLGTFIICLILSVALGFFLVVPKYSAYSDAKKINAENNANLEDLKTKQNMLDDMFVKVQEKTSQLDAADEAIPDKPDVPEVYAYIEALTKSVNLTIGTIQVVDTNEDPSEEQAGAASNASIPVDPTVKSSSISPTIGVIDINLQVSGSFNDFVSLLGKLQKSLRLIDVQSINIASADGRDGLAFIVSMKTYYQK
jgi:hypothetical protein